MNAFTKKVSRISLLALSLFMWSCDNLGQTTAPETLDPKGYAVFSSTTGEQFVVIREAESVGAVSASIGASGGELHLGAHTLEVPAGAVNAPTVFAMSRTDGDLVRIRLSATRNSHNDVGSTGFNKPVKLSISFAGASDLPALAEDDLKVIYFRPDGLVEEQGTSLNLRGDFATGELDHFSDFGLAWPSRCLLRVICL